MTTAIRTINTDNPNCDGNHCLHKSGAVKVYPLGSGGNLILCRACWNHENAYRRSRGRETSQPENWPENEWGQAEKYHIT